jgi:hypothetical protein
MMRVTVLRGREGPGDYSLPVDLQFLEADGGLPGS